MASQTALGQPAGVAETEPRWSEDHRDAVSASTGPPAMPSPGLPRPTSELQPPEAGLAARAAKEAAQVAHSASRVGTATDARRLPATQSHHLRRLAPSSAPLRSDFSMLHVGAEAAQLFGDHDQQALTRPNRPRRRSRDRPRWRRGGQQASDTPSRPQRERARAVAAAKRLIQRLCSGFSASCLQGSLQIFPGHLFWPFRSHFGNLWRSIPI